MRVITCCPACRTHWPALVTSEIAGKMECCACGTVLPMEEFHDGPGIAAVRLSDEGMRTIAAADAWSERTGRMALVWTNRAGEIHILPAGIFTDEWLYERGRAIIHRTGGAR